MNWNKLITELKECGISETKLTKKVNSLGVPVTQPTINRLKTGEIKTINYDVGNAIVNIHHQFCCTETQKSA